MAGADTGVLELPYQASGAITRMRFVKLSGDQTVQQCDTLGEVALGVSKVSISADEATAGKGTAVQVLGVAWVEAGAAITRGADVSTTTAGKATPALTTHRALGRALKAAAADLDWIPVLLYGSAGRVMP
jgi:hypothetical protein